MAATASNPQIGMTISATLNGPAIGSSTTQANINQATASVFTVGMVTGNVNKVYDSTFTIASTGTPTTIDLTSVTDALGNALTFTQITAVLVTCTSTVTTDSLTIGGGTNGVFANASPPIYPATVSSAATGSGFAWSSGNLNAVNVDSTHKIISLVGVSGTAITGHITVFGK